VQSLRDVLIWWQRLSLNYQRNRVALAAGGLAYFVALSVAPAALAFGTMAGLVLDPAQVRDALERLAERTPGTVDAFRPMLESLLSTIETASASTFTITALISVFVAIYGASKVVFGLRMAMNTIFGVIETRSGLIDRAISAVVTLVGLVVAVGLVVVAAVLPSVLAELGVDRPSLLTGSPWVEWLVIAILVYLAARWLLAHAPDHSRRVPWASRGALVATVGILVVTAGVGVYARLSTSLNAAVLVLARPSSSCCGSTCASCRCCGARSSRPTTSAFEATRLRPGHPPRRTGHQAGDEGADGRPETQLGRGRERGEDAEQPAAEAEHHRASAGERDPAHAAAVAVPALRRDCTRRSLGGLRRPGLLLDLPQEPLDLVFSHTVIVPRPDHVLSL
jgi:uncharacterized BrkB/YihY/UPF0761 family membrane protein